MDNEKKTESGGGKKKIWKTVVLSIGGVVLAVLLAAYGYFYSKYSLVYDDGKAPEIQEGTDYEEIVGSSEERADEMEQAVAGLEQQEAVEATGEISDSKNVYNILLIGTDERTVGEYSENARGDTCILLSINTAGDVPVISLISFERGIGVPILEGEYAGQWDWLTHTFRYGGAELLMKEISECFKVDVDHYVRVNFKAFETGINAIGGVDVYMDEAETRYFIDGHISSDVYVGMNHFNGRLALAYARLREIDTDWQRIERQREVIISAINNCRDLSLAEINSLIDQLLPMVKTNIPQTKIAELLLLIPELRNAEIQQTTIPLAGTYGGMKGMGGRSLFAVDFEANAKFLKEYLYGEKTE